MLYTGSVNRIIFWGLIPFIFALFLLFRVFEWQSLDDGGRQKIAEQHEINLTNRSGIDCIILGGSNSVFSLSAEQMSIGSGLNCYNLSLLNEGYSDLAYFEFIRRMPIDRTEITTVLYSSVMPLSADSFSERLKHNEEFVGISGETDFQLIRRSIASYVKDLLQGKPLFTFNQYPTPNSNGDFRFELYDGCDATRIQINWTPVTFNKSFKQWLENNIRTVKDLFPNAEISLVLPSTMRTNLDEETFDNFSSSLQAEVVRQSVKYIEQSQFSDINLLCESVCHANALGRELRTTELLSLIRTSN